jgi:hypothetical protein
MRAFAVSKQTAFKRTPQTHRRHQHQAYVLMSKVISLISVLLLHEFCARNNQAAVLIHSHLLHFARRFILKVLLPRNARARGV